MKENNTSGKKPISRRASMDDDRHLGDLSEFRKSVAEGDISDDDEFGDASNLDQPVESYLQRSLEDDDDEGPPSGSAALTPNSKPIPSLDLEKHEDLSELMQNSENSRTRNEEDGDDCLQDEDEFGGAAATDVPVASFLRANMSLEEQHLHDAIQHQSHEQGRSPTNRSKKDPSASAANLDAEKHDDLGDFLSPAVMQVKLNDVNDVDDVDEFGGAGDTDVPVPKFLRTSMDEVDLKPFVETVRKEIAAGELDVSKHDDLNDFVDPRDEDLVVEEFELADLKEKAVERYLRSQDSQDDMYYDYSMPTHKAILDDEDHRPIEQADELEGDEFGDPEDEAAPVRPYLRAQDSMDEAYFEAHERYLEERKSRETEAETPDLQ